MFCSIFFFSSRRRHTRLQGDWSSDVCSSDLAKQSNSSAAGRRQAGRRTPAARRTSTAPIGWGWPGACGHLGSPSGAARLVVGRRGRSPDEDDHRVRGRRVDPGADWNAAGDLGLRQAGPRSAIAEEGGAQAAGRGTPSTGGAVVVVASLIGYVIGHVLTGEPMAVSGGLVLGLMTGLGLAGFANDVIKIRGRRSAGLRGANLAQGLDGIQTGAAITVLAGYVLIINSQLRADCTTLLTQHCYLVRNPLDVAVAAASVLGACTGF